jgi:hypothetical protein
VVTVIRRGQVSSKAVPTLVVQLTVRIAGDTVDLSAISPGQTRRVNWTEQAERIYVQIAAFADKHYAALVRLRAIK